ncbi:ABC transporter ATP-binding protein [Spongiibacter sp. KMU-158]|uniref:ABC transporter ATP-binding protein n=1 Tax=Spongiibacter pelagi TaxID=2760804 RepID=A0A927C4A0_9GAMM|nr:ATP-binding cassette domain-containing protein [Spongiibacter pelagi]MBD2859898.1 ABC transporter ATP-binding protein [Spongiibacter pelagi]
MSDALLEVKELHLHYPLKKRHLLDKPSAFKAVNGVSLFVNPGETLGLVGESGCGKSSLGKAILNLQTPTAGEVWFQKTDISKLSNREMRPIRRDLQMIFQDPYESLNSRHTVSSILEEPLIIHSLGDRNQRRKTVSALLDQVGLPQSAANKYPHEFSGGQRQRIGIARAIALQPKLLICDEPVSALDVSVQAQILNLLMDIQQDMGLAMLFISHDLSVVRHMSDRIAVMHQGQIVETGNAEDIYCQPQHDYTRLLLDSIPQIAQ